MSYCVNCGVELAESEPRCPLCGVPVQNPAHPYDPQAPGPYPPHLESAQPELNRKHLALFAGLLLLLPACICLFCDLVGGDGLSWSGYVIASLALCYLVIFVPPLLPFRAPYPALVLDTLGLLIFLRVVEQQAGGDWYMALGLPLTLLCAVLVMAVVLLGRLKPELGILGLSGLALFAAGLLALLVEIHVDFYLHSALFFDWSFFVLIPCALIGLVFLLLNRNQAFREQLRRRFFL